MGIRDIGWGRDRRYWGSSGWRKCPLHVDQRMENVALALAVAAVVALTLAFTALCRHISYTRSVAFRRPWGSIFGNGRGGKDTDIKRFRKQNVLDSF